MGRPSVKNFLMALGLALMVAGAVMRIKGNDDAWYVIGLSLVVYLFARFFYSRKE